MPHATKRMTLGDFLTDAQIQECLALYEAHDHSQGSFAAVVRKRVLEPNIAAIDAKLGCPSDPAYLAYAVEYVLNANARASS